MKAFQVVSEISVVSIVNDKTIFHVVLNVSIVSNETTLHVILNVSIVSIVR